MAIPLGKRYVCAACGTQVLVTKSGEGTLVCCDKDMTLQEAKPLPSSD
ncbi:MAG: desulforedoxin [Dehalococcoidia bacterium]|nr:desulforedoxin [Dehalococcoidia bacterium]